MARLGDVTKLDWLSIGLELDYRSKYYSMLGTTPDQSHQWGGVLFEKLRRRVENNNKERFAGEWEWIFEPLILKILSKRALWVCLGHFAGDRRDPRRDWFYFFSKDLSCNSSSLTRALRVFSFNANYGELARNVILPSAQLLESLSPISTRVKPGYPYGALFVASLQSKPIDKGTADIVVNDRIFAVDWQDLFEKAKEKDWREAIKEDSRALFGKAIEKTERYDILRCGRVNDAEDIRRIKRSAASAKEMVSFCWEKNGEKDKFLEYAQIYSKALEGSFPKDLTLGDGHYDVRYREHFRTLFDKNPSFHRKIAQYVAWIQDVADKSSQLITIPAWLPGEGSTGRSGAIIVCMEHGYELLLDDLIGFSTAFRLGCVNVALESAKGLSRKGAHHYIPKLFTAAIDELLDFQEKHNPKPGEINPKCLHRFDIPPQFIIAIGTLYELSGDPMDRPRFQRIEKELREKGITRYVIEFLFENVAKILGEIRLATELTGDEILEEGQHAELAKPSGSWNAKVRLKDAEVTYLPALLGLLLTEAWEHTTRLTIKRNADRPLKKVKVSICGDYIVLENPCDENTEYREDSNQLWDIDRLRDKLLIWHVDKPPQESIKKGRWIRKIWREQ